MLHPAEFIALHRRDLILPADAVSADRVAYAHVRKPKTARFARRQHARLDDNLVLQFLETRYGHLPLPEKLLRGSLHTYRRQWNAIMTHLGLPIPSKLGEPPQEFFLGRPFCILKLNMFNLSPGRGAGVS